MLLELGGNGPTIVFDDADLDAAVARTAFGCFANAGQICDSTERILVQRRVHDCHVEFEESGTVNLRLVVDGPSGRVREVTILPPFDKTPAGLCVRAALKGTAFSKTRTPGQEIKIPVYLR